MHRVTRTRSGQPAGVEGRDKVAPGRDPDRALFADELRAVRKQANLSRDELGAKVGYSGASIGMIESMHRAPPRGIGKRLDAEFGLPGTFDRIEERLRGIPFATAFRPFVPHEVAARTLRWFEHSLIPGLLQTEDYARAVLATKPNTTEDEINRLVSERLELQLILEREDPPAPLLWVLLDEGALTRPVADPPVMRDQLKHLVHMTTIPNVTIQIVPYTARGHSGLLGAFIIADLDDSPGIVFLEDVLGGRVSEEPDVVAEATLRFDSLRSEALPKGVSREMMGSVAEEKWT
jgi:transcriptional regulator with XRE-family HTH domain